LIESFSVTSLLKCIPDAEEDTFLNSVGRVWQAANKITRGIKRLESTKEQALAFLVCCIIL